MDQIHKVWHSPVVVTLLSIHCNFSHFDAAAVTVFVIVIRVTAGIVCLSSHTARTEWHLQTLFGSRAICIAWQFKYFALIYALLNDNTCVVIKMFILREFFFFVLLIILQQLRKGERCSAVNIQQSIYSLSPYFSRPTRQQRPLLFMLAHIWAGNFQK